MIKTTIYSTRWKNQKEKQDKEDEEDIYSAALLIAETSLSPSSSLLQELRSIQIDGVSQAVTHHHSQTIKQLRKTSYFKALPFQRHIEEFTYQGSILRKVLLLCCLSASRWAATQWLFFIVDRSVFLSCILSHVSCIYFLGHIFSQWFHCI